MRYACRLFYVFFLLVAIVGIHSCGKEPISPPEIRVFENAITLSYTKVSVSAEVTDQGGAEVKSRGFAYGKSNGKQDTVFCGAGTGVFSAELSGLEPNTTYNYEAFARNTGGTSLSGKVTFTTMELGKPSVRTLEVTEESASTAVCRGRVTDNGGSTVTVRGVCWSERPAPTVNDGHAESGSGSDEYSCEMTGLSSGKTYHVRAYATNSQGTGYGEELELKMEEEYTVSASVYPAGSGEVTVSGDGHVINGRECTVTATAKHGYRFKRWTENGTEVSTEASYTFTVSGNRTLVAVFEPKGYDITLSANPSEGGEVSGGGNILFGQPCTVKATRNHGYSFTNWTEGGTEVSTDASYTFTVNKARTLVANFAPKSYQITVSANPPEGGEVSGGGSVTFGQPHTVTATPADGYKFTNWTVGGTEVSTDKSYTFTVNGNQTLVANFAIMLQAPEGAINGLFSVSATEKVWFSRGNLQYVGSSGTWKFATKQWTMVGTSQGNTTPNTTRDLFGWGASGYNHGAVCYQPWSTSHTNSDYYAYGNSSFNLFDQTGKADWGYNAISNGGNQTNQWRTLTREEWEYVFNARTTASGIRFVKAKVNNVNGVILLPDDWNSSIYSLGNTNQSGADFTSNTISSSQWSTLENAGAVFLPTAGLRVGTSVGSIGSIGQYWSASYSNSSQAYYVIFDSSKLNPQNIGHRYFGQSVRLVRSAQ